MAKTLQVDTISERTAANGVVIDGVTLKDGAVTATSSSTFPGFTATSDITIQSSGTNYAIFKSTDSNTAELGLRFLNTSSAIAGGMVCIPNTVGTDTVLNFYVGGNTGSDLKMIISDTGQVGVGASPTAYFDTQSHSTFNAQIGYFKANNTSYSSNCVQAYVNRARSATGFTFFVGQNTTAVDYIVQGDGDVENFNNSYTGISDRRLKTNITDTPSKLDDLMKVKIRSYNMKSDGQKHIGVIADELAGVFPSLVKSQPAIADYKDAEGNVLISEGEDKYSVKYSIFVPILIKALQELKVKVDALETA